MIFTKVECMTKDLIIKKSKIDKKGVFAARNFKKGEVITKWSQNTIKKSEIDKLAANDRHYIYKAGGYKYLLMQSPEKYVNHSCAANTRVKNNCDIAIRDIRKGEEITSDYEKGSSVSFECKCDSKNCRGMIK